MPENAFLNLTSVVWNLTNKCNFNCTFCYTNSNPHKQYGLTTKELIKIANKLNKTQVKVLSLIGGEPLLRKDINEIIDAIDDQIYLKLDTNASLLLKKWNNSFEKINAYSIGIDGDKSINEIDRKNTSSVTNAIKFLIKNGKTVNTPILVNNKNFKSIKDSINFVFELGVDLIQFNRFIPVIGSSNFNLSLSIEQENFVISEINELINEKPEFKKRLKLKGWKNSNYFENLKDKNTNLTNC